MALTDKLTAIADGFRLSRGTSKKYTLDDMAILAAENIVASSDGSPIEVEKNINLSIKVSITAGKYYSHMLFNGVRLPRIPIDVLASYPYAWIRKNTTSGYYDLILSDKPFYYKSTPGVYEANGATGKPWYRVSISGAATATAWTNNTSANTYNWWGLDSARTVFWSNHDMPNGSATATDIYFAGSEPVPTD